MTGALTLTEAAERLAPAFDDKESSSAVEKSPKGKWLTLESAGELLSERFSGQPTVAKKKASAVTIEQAARQIEAPYVDLADLRSKRESATLNHMQALVDLHDFSNKAVELFQGMDSNALAASPDFQAALDYEQKLKNACELARRKEHEAWAKECAAENEVFLAGRPGWGAAGSKGAAEFLMRLGLSEQEMWLLWDSPQPIDVASPMCMTLAQMIVGASHPTPIHAALGSVGFDATEIASVMSGDTKILLRDHRIQELVARAVDANTPPEDRAAA